MSVCLLDTQLRISKRTNTVLCLVGSSGSRVRGRGGGYWQYQWKRRQGRLPEEDKEFVKALVRQERHGRSCLHPAVVAERPSSAAAVTWTKPSVCYSSPSVERPSATCQRPRRRPESAASACCSSVVSEASLVFYCGPRKKNQFSIVSQTVAVQITFVEAQLKAKCAWWPQGGAVETH